MTIDELIVKLGFKLDKKGLEQFNKSIDGIEKKLKLAGVALAGVSIFEGMQLERAEKELKSFVDSDVFNRLQEDIKKLNIEFNIVNEKEATKAGLFISKFNKDLIGTEKLIEFAGKRALVTGKSFEETFGKIKSFITSKDVGALRDLGLITQDEFIAFTAGRNPYEKMTIQQAELAFQAKLTKDVFEDLNKEIAKSQDEFTTQFDQSIKIVNKLATSIYSFLDPALAFGAKSFNTFMKDLMAWNDELDVWAKSAIEGAESNFGKGIYSIIFGSPDDIINGFKLISSAWEEMFADTEKVRLGFEAQRLESEAPFKQAGEELSQGFQNLPEDFSSASSSNFDAFGKSFGDLKNLFGSGNQESDLKPLPQQSQKNAVSISGDATITVKVESEGKVTPEAETGIMELVKNTVDNAFTKLSVDLGQ